MTKGGFIKKVSEKKLTLVLCYAIASRVATVHKYTEGMRRTGYSTVLLAILRCTLNMIVALSIKGPTA